MRHHPILLTSFLLLLGCGHAADEQQKTVLPYFDLKGYFKKEASRLQKANPWIDKTVSINTSGEMKSLRIADWTKELAVIADADINKASWRGLFAVSKKGGKVYYTSTEEKVPVKAVIVSYSNNKPSGLVVLMKTSNALYTSTDSLFYYPDSLYQIHKSQQIRFLPNKDYRITLKFR